MGERRNHKLFRDTENENKPTSGMREHDPWAGKDHHSSHGSGRYHDFSDSRTISSRVSRDDSGWPSWESIVEHPIAPMAQNFKNTYEAKEMTYEEKEMSGGNRYHKNNSPGFEEMDLHSYNHTQEYDRSHSQRYMGKGRSRSQSRSRTRRRSLSKERERERERERGRGRGWSRSRSRSRSRSDGYGYTIDHRRSHSPIRDYRRQSHGRSDRRGAPEKSSQTCRDFASGWCRKGSQCRFIHPTSLSRKDGNLVEDDRVESWRSRSNHNQIIKHSYTRFGFESRNDVSDLYHGEDEQFLHRSRSSSSIPCRDFKQGYCRWGDSCRFSHDAASTDSFGQENRDSTFDKEEFDHQRHKRGKPICKFFAAGNCNRDKCRFSHDEPNLNKLEGRLDKVTESQSSHDKGNWWNAPKWDDATRMSDTAMSTGWGEAIATNTTSSHDATNGKNDENWWNAPKWDDATRTSNTPKSTGWGEAIATNTTSSRDATNGQSVDNWRNAPTWDDATRTSNTPKSTGWGEAIATNTTRSHDATNGQTVDNWRNAPKWDDATRTSNIPKSTGWGEAIATNTTNSCDATNGQTVDNWRNAPKWDDERRISDTPMSTGWGEAIATNTTISRDATTGQSVDNWRNAPKWDDERRISNTPMSTGWGEAITTNTTSSHDATNGQGDDRWGLSSKDENKWRIVDWTSNSLDSERHPSLLGESGSHGGDTGPAKSIVMDHMPNKQEDLKLSALEENQSLIVKALQQNDKNILSPRLLKAQVPQILTNLLSSISNSPVTNASQQVSAVTDPVSLIRSFVNDRSLTNAGISSRGTFPSFSSITGSLPPVSTIGVQDSLHDASLDQFNSVGNDKEYTEQGNHNLAQGTDQNNDMQLRRSSPSPIIATGVEISKLKHPESPRQQMKVVADVGVTGDKAMGDESKEVQEIRPSEDGKGKPEEGSANKDEKGLRLFKNSLVEFVKEILKPTWNEGQMSREVHKNVVKKVVDKVYSAIQVDHIPKTQDKIDQYLSQSKPKITKLVQAYVERCRKTDT